MQRRRRRRQAPVKSIAKSFIQFLEENDLKHEMAKSDLKEKYELQFRPSCNGSSVCFSRVLSTLKNRLNLCQVIRGRVVFGDGEAAALRILDSDESTSEEEERDDMERNLRCTTCKMDFHTDALLRKHLESGSHHQQSVLRTIRQSVEKPDLVKDKRGITVTSVPPGNENGVIELKVQRNKREQITLIVKNTGTEEVELKDITLLWKVNFFQCSDLLRIGSNGEDVDAGKQQPQAMSGLSLRSLTNNVSKLRQLGCFYNSSGWLKRDSLHMEKLERYDIPPTVIAQQDRKGIREKLEKPLTFDTYKEKFRLLLQLEEIQMRKDIRHYDMKEVELEQDRDDRGLLKLEVPGLAENRPSVLRGDRIYAYEHGLRHHRYEGIVHKVKLQDLILGFDRSKIPFIKGKKFDIQFTFNRLTVQMEHRACERIASECKKDMREVLFPQQEILHRGVIVNQVDDRSFYDRNLNDEQKQAVQKILSGSSRPAPYLVFGPPGTGKTVTLVEAIKQIHKQINSSVILVCAPENSAADLLAERLLDHVDKGKLFRMYAASRTWDSVSLRLKEHQDPHAQVMNFDRVTREVHYPSKEELTRNYRIIVTTLVTAGRLVSASFPRRHFTHIFIDEAGHATEPECIIPLADLLDPANPIGGQLVLAGDPKQLGPILRCKKTQEYGLGISLLERLMMSCNTYRREPDKGYNPNLLTKLVNNYRSHRDIIEIPKQLFYDNELKECAGEIGDIMLDWEELPNKKFPMIFHAVYGKDEREENSPSFFNVTEVETVELYLKKLLDDKRKHLKPKMVGIISPYKKQVQKIQKMIEKRRLGSGIKVGSVEEFQGQERIVIILSTVRSTNKDYLDMDKEFHLGFLDNPKRFNVAVTRAQALLIVIGNPNMLRMDENWTRLLEYCNENDACVGAERNNEAANIANVLRKLHLYEEESPEVRDSEISQRQLQEQPEWPRRE
ncbi:putative helicase MOV-10 [Stylophora pistillata]|uniref:RNA helicase n=1 Tax=Stylophora pistillata TaxID=50429 RepID=A0A2B4RJ77_STYPI|nr:putative helicase MOV-10 [Stylophora pistillata]